MRFITTFLMVKSFFILRSELTRFAVISHLSAGDHAVPEENFKTILQYIFTFIDKVSSIVVTLRIFDHNK